MDQDQCPGLSLQGQAEEAVRKGTGADRPQGERPDRDQVRALACTPRHFLGLSTGFRASPGWAEWEGRESEWLLGQGGWWAAFLGAGHSGQGQVLCGVKACSCFSPWVRAGHTPCGVPRPVLRALARVTGPHWLPLQHWLSSSFQEGHVAQRWGASSLPVGRVTLKGRWSLTLGVFDFLLSEG